MTPRSRLRIQVAGILDAEEVQMLLEEGVDDIGIPFGPGIVTPELNESQLRTVLDSTHDRTPFVWITYARTAAEVLEGIERFGFEKVQLHAEIEAGEVAALRQQAPELWISKAFAIGRYPVNVLFSQLPAYTPFLNWLFLDTYDRNTGHTGATGKTHDWSHSARVVDSSPVPVMLAGGLRPENVTEAVAQVSPAGVDAHTGLEGADGRKVRAAVQTFIQKAKQGDIRKFTR